jgi:hypothetical protein
MDGETDKTLLVTDDTATTDDQMVSGVESDTVAACSSSNVAAEKIAKKDVPMMTDYWKTSKVTEVSDWLLSRVESSISDLEFPTVDNTTIVCFESHLIST